MKYNLENEQEYKEATAFLVGCMMRNKTVEIKVYRPNRTLNQNSYLHLLLTIFAVEFGYTLEESKTLYKRVNSATYAYEKNGQKFLRSSTDLDTKEMADTIEKFKQYSSEHGLELPDAYDEDKLRYYENQIEKQRKYL